MCSVRKSIHWHFYSKLCTVKRKISKISMVNNKQPWFIRLKCDILDSLEMGKNKCVFINLPGPLTLHSRWFHLIKQVYAFTSRTIHFSFECQVYLDSSSLMYQCINVSMNHAELESNRQYRATIQFVALIIKFKRNSLFWGRV